MGFLSGENIFIANFIAIYRGSYSLTIIYSESQGKMFNMIYANTPSFLFWYFMERKKLFCISKLYFSSLVALNIRACKGVPEHTDQQQTFETFKEKFCIYMSSYDSHVVHALSGSYKI
jgi:hypothetical protein